MPRASDELRAVWNAMDDACGAEAAAWKQCKDAGLTEKAGMIQVPSNLSMSPLTWSAICYLCDEWDYGWQMCKPRSLEE